MEKQQDIEETVKMLADYMENGFLDNIVSMFRQDMTYYPYIGELLGDERLGVRIGTTALVETLLEDYSDNVFSAIPGIARLLKNENPTIRGDAAHLLGIIGHKDALPFLADTVNDEHYLVRETAEEAIDNIMTVDSD
jgi:hypothetical protein